MLKIILSIAFIVHGLAHISGFLAAWTNARVDFKSKSRFLGMEFNLKSIPGRLVGLLWIVALVLFVLSGRALLSDYTSWLWLAQLGAMASLICILSFWKAVPKGAKIGFVLDLLILATYLPLLRDFLVNLL